MLYLASTSPRRKELLQQIGLEFECLAIDVDESVVRQESPQCYVARLSKIKADAGLALCEHQPEAVVIAADIGRVDV
jgi:septum formation protein